MPLGMFSVVGMTAMTGCGASSRASAHIAPATAAPPAMSFFIRSMPSAGLIEIPPVSNVMPLPTRPRTGRAGRRRRAVAQHDHARRLGTALPDGQEQPHAQLANLPLVQDLDVQTDAGGFGCHAVGELASASGCWPARWPTRARDSPHSARIRPRRTAASVCDGSPPGSDDLDRDWDSCRHWPGRSCRRRRRIRPPTAHRRRAASIRSPPARTTKPTGRRHDAAPRTRRPPRHDARAGRPAPPATRRPPARCASRGTGQPRRPA